jgi:spermidine/putrescine transport system substrate-binding protein
MIGAAGISVNKKQVKTYDKSWSIFGRKDLKGRMTMLDDMREVLGAALKSLGYSVNSRNPDELAQAKKIVQGWRDTIMKFDAESFAKGFAAEEFFVVQGYAENVFLELDEAKKADVDFFIPREGGPMYMDSMVILKDAKNKDLAYDFINFIHRPDIYAMIVDYLMLPSINTKARELVKVKPNYTYEDLANCEFKEDLGKDVELYDKIWQEIRVGK